MPREFIRSETYGVSNYVRFYYDRTKQHGRFEAEILVYDASAQNETRAITGAGNTQEAAWSCLKFCLAIHNAKDQRADIERRNAKSDTAKKDEAAA